MPARRPALLFLALLSALPALGRDDDDDDDAPPPTAAARPAEASGAAPQAGVVRLSAERQRAAGLVAAPLRAATLQPETESYAKVLDLQPLLELRVRYRAAQSEAEVAAAAYALAQANRDRLSALHQAEIVAQRELIQAQAQWQSDRAREAAARRLVEEIRREARQAWGEALARLALDGDAPLFEDLLSHRRALLLVALPPGYVPPPGAILFVAREHERARAMRAEPLSPATKTDELVQGETWFYHAADATLRAGMRVHAWAPVSGQRLNGVALPLTAVVWHAGQPWAYRQMDAERFARTAIASYRDDAGGWFVAQGFAPGERVVVTGGQMLLSEELRGQIPDEDDD